MKSSRIKKRGLNFNRVKHEITLTRTGKEKQEKIRNFIKNIYSIYNKDVEDFNKTLKAFNLL